MMSADGWEYAQAFRIDTGESVTIVSFFVSDGKPMVLYRRDDGTLQSTTADNIRTELPKW